MSMKQVQISVDGAGRGKVFVDGHDLSGVVQKIEFTTTARELTTVTLHLAPIAVEIEAVAEVKEIAPVADEHGQLWKQFEQVNPHG